MHKFSQLIDFPGMIKNNFLDASYKIRYSETVGSPEKFPFVISDLAWYLFYQQDMSKQLL